MACLSRVAATEVEKKSLNYGNNFKENPLHVLHLLENLIFSGDGPILGPYHMTHVTCTNRHEYNVLE